MTHSISQLRHVGMSAPTVIFSKLWLPWWIFQYVRTQWMTSYFMEIRTHNWALYSSLPKTVRFKGVWIQTHSTDYQNTRQLWIIDSRVLSREWEKINFTLATVMRVKKTVAWHTRRSARPWPLHMNKEHCNPTTIKFFSSDPRQHFCWVMSTLNLYPRRMRKRGNTSTPYSACWLLSRNRKRQAVKVFRSNPVFESFKIISEN